jgi:hypothetical protein
MTIFNFADIIDKKLSIIYHQNQGGRFSTAFEHCELKENSFLKSSYGNGKTINESINNYIVQIIGKTIVFNAYRENRQEFIVPNDIDY